MIKQREFISCMRPSARTRADNGSLKRQFKILKFSRSRSEIKFKSCVSEVKLKFA